MLLAENNERMALVSGETPLFALFSGRYSDGPPPIEIFLSAHNAEAYRDHRVSRAANVLKMPRLAMLLGTQPRVIRDVRKKPELDDRGLIGRFVFCMPPSRRGYRDTALVEMPEDVRRNYNLKMLAMGRRAHERGESLRLLLSEKTGERFEQWRATIEPRLRLGEDLAHLSSFPDKLPATVARIAGLLHLLRGHEGEQIEPDTFDDATKVVDFLIDQFREVFGLISEPPSVALAKRIREWVDRKDLQRFTLRECQNKGPAQRFTSAEILEALEELQADGFLALKEERRSNRGRPTIMASVL